MTYDLWLYSQGGQGLWHESLTLNRMWPTWLTQDALCEYLLLIQFKKEQIQGRLGGSVGQMSNSWFWLGWWLQGCEIKAPWRTWSLLNILDLSRSLCPSPHLSLLSSLSLKINKNKKNEFITFWVSWHVSTSSCHKKDDFLSRIRNTFLS